MSLDRKLGIQYSYKSNTKRQQLSPSKRRWQMVLVMWSNLLAVVVRVQCRFLITTTWNEGDAICTFVNACCTEPTRIQPFPYGIHLILINFHIWYSKKSINKFWKTIPYGFYLIFINIDEDVIWSNVRWLQSSEEAGPCILAELSTGRVDQIISIVAELDKRCSTTLSRAGCRGQSLSKSCFFSQTD